MWQRLIWLICLIVALFIILVWYTTTPRWVDSGELSVIWSENQSWQLEGAVVRWDAASEQLSIHHNQTPVWASSPGQPWLNAAIPLGDLNDGAVARGVLHQLVDLCSSQNWTDARTEGTSRLVLAGELHCGAGSLPVTFGVTVRDDHVLQIDWQVEHVELTSSTGEPIELAATLLDFSMADDEAFFGFGPQTGGWNRRGERVALPLNERPDFSDSVSGHLVLTSTGRALVLPAGTQKFFDLRSTETARLETWHQSSGALTLYQGSDPAATMTRMAEIMGRMTGLPERIHRFADPGDALRNAPASEFPNSSWPENDVWSGQEEPLTRSMVHEIGPLETGWGPQRGLQGSLMALLNGGVSGVSVAYSLVGGTEMAEQLWWQKPRSMELFLRWLELNTFTAWLRLSEGDLPDEHFQITDSIAGEVHFDRLAALYHTLAPYREQLMTDASERGWPVVRPVWFEYPEDPVSWTLPPDQFLMGSQLLVAPVMTKGATERTFYLPAGEWTHLWTRAEFDSAGEFMTLSAPIGEPLVLVRKDFPFREQLLSVAGDLAISR